jgi:hypothetical protein
VSDGCKRGCKILFFPDAASVYYADRVYCPYTKETFMVVPIEKTEAKNIAKNLAAIKDNSPAVAAQVSFAANEIADRTKNKGIKEAYSFQSYVEAAKFLGASSAVTYDPKQKEIVPSPELESKIEQFQNNQGLKQTGNLDYRTLQKASGKTTNDLLRGN